MFNLSLLYTTVFPKSTTLYHFFRIYFRLIVSLFPEKRYNIVRKKERSENQNERKQETVENNEIAAVLVNEDTEATLKRVRFQGVQLSQSYTTPNNT